MHGQYGGEETEHADREERPDEEEGSTRVPDAAGDADTSSLHVDEGNDQRKKRPKQDDDVPRSPSGEHQRSV